MGEVYLAEDSELQRTVAIKRMSRRWVGDERHRQRFLREARMASRLNDPHIAAVYDVFERQGEIFLVMERVEGETLRRRLQRPMALDEFLPLAAQCAEALAVAHAQGVLHRDIKPDNIMVTPAHQVKILDFGLARGMSEEEETVACATEPGSVSGTAGYIAPEVLVGGEPDARADIFSLGVVFYEGLTGSHPFLAKTSFASSNLVLHLDPPPPSSVSPVVSPELDRIVMRMLAREPGARYQSASDLGADLRWIERSAAAVTMAAPRVSERPGRRRWRWRRWALVGAAAAAATLVAVWAAPLVRRGAAGPTDVEPAPQAARQLAVLPFEALGGTPAQQAFAAGLTDTVTARLTELSATQALAVVPASLVFSRKIDSADAARRQFGVTMVLTGSLQQAGTEIRVTYALVDAKNRRQLSASTKTAEAGNPFAIEDDVASGVLEMLQVQLEPGQRRKFEEKGTDKPGAYEFYLQGMGYLQNYNREENVTNAISLFERALQIDARYAGAYAGLGMAYWHRYLLSDDPRWTAPSRQACNRALSIDANLAAAHVCLGTVDNGTGQYLEAATQFQKALAAQPTDDAAYEGLGDAYEKQGRQAEAERTYRQAIRLRPQYWAGYSWLGIFHFNQGRYAEAARMFEQVVALAPDDPDAKYTAAIVYTEVKEPEQGLQWLKKALAAGASVAMARNEPAFADLREMRGFPESLQER